ncbi:MAG: spore coat protein U domain-containing protein [Tateyamaria sp.]|jgi:spore coat protein U-like protein|nr:spore coat protein U domain-containing protein [Tateyamaria sp.]
MKTKFNQNKLKPAALSAIAFGSAFFCSHSRADSVNSIMNVSVSVKHSCSINTTPMAFGAYDGVSTNASRSLATTATIISTCTSGTGAHITLNTGTFAGSGSADAPVRRMSAGEGKYLVYQVYSDFTRHTVWGNTVPTGVALTGTGAAQTLTVYGSIPSAQMVPQGDYSDQISITITY